MRFAINLFRCSHPEPTAGVTALATILALSLGRGWGSLWVAAAVLCGQLSVGWANDLLDADRDRAAGRRDKPAALGVVPAASLRRGVLAALVLAVAFSLASGLAATLAHLFALAMAHLYNFRLKFTRLSVAAYALAFAMLPVFVTLGLSPSRLPPWWAVLAAAAIGAGAHFTNALDDLDRDRAQGVLGLPQRLGPGGSIAAAAALMAVGVLLEVFGPGRAPSGAALAALALTGVLIALVALAAVAGRREDAFRLTIATAGAAVLAFLLGGRADL
jgi:4-hydroxybenzoate polyprenyltransferase